LKAEEERNEKEIAALLKEETQGLPKGLARLSLFAASKKPKAAASSESRISLQV